MITAKGPTYGKALVAIDGVNRGTFDFYAATQRWLVRQTFTNLGTGVHHVVITATGSKNPNSSGTTVVFDAVTLR